MSNFPTLFSNYFSRNNDQNSYFKKGEYLGLHIFNIFIMKAKSTDIYYHIP